MSHHVHRFNVHALFFREGLGHNANGRSLVMTPEFLFFFFNTVKTRRLGLKQPKFVLHCKQLPVGLLRAIG